jgi:aspartate racemase
MNTLKNAVGVLGGMGPQASIRFYNDVINISIKNYNVKKNGEFPHILLDNIPVPDLVKNKKDQIKTVNLVSKEALKLKIAGAKFIVMPCNTMHLYADKIMKNVNIKFVSMIDSVVAKVKKDNISVVGILGTQTTISSGLYSKVLELNGIKVIEADPKDNKAIANIIHKVIAGRIKNSDKEKFYAIAKKLSKNGAEAIILGCTELPLLLNDKKTAIKFYDSPRILAEKVCENIYKVKIEKTMLVVKKIK